MTTSKPNAVSLFSGAGGIDIGLHQAGIETKVCVEQDGVAARTLKVNSAHYPGSTSPSGLISGKYPWQVIQQDIRKISGGDIRQVGQLDEGDIDLVVGGPPCQTFSRSNEGSREGTSRSKGRLFEEFARILQELKPTAFIFENVQGLTSSNNGEDLNAVLDTLSGRVYDTPPGHASKISAYGLNYEVLDAADYGIPQARNRLLIIGHLESGAPDFPKPTHKGKERIFSKKALGTFDIDEESEIPEYVNAVGGEYGHLLSDIPPGANYQHFSERRYDTETSEYIPRDSEELHEKVFDWRSRHWNYLLKQDPKRPAWTIQARPGTYVGPFHWRSRPFSLLEKMALQDLPRDYFIAGGKAAIQRQIGNAAPPGLISVLASHLMGSIGYDLPSEEESGEDEFEADSLEGKGSTRIAINGKFSPWIAGCKALASIMDGSGVTVLGEGPGVADVVDVGYILERHSCSEMNFSFEETLVANGDKNGQSRVELLVSPS